MKIRYEDMLLYGVNEEKKPTLTLADRLIFRPIGFLLAPILYNQLRLTPNMVSIFSLLVSAVGFIIIFLSTDTLGVLLGCLFLLFFMVLDCVDGSIARVLYSKFNLKNPLGEFFDAFAGYFFIIGLWSSFGYYLTVLNNDINWYIAGTVSSFASLFSRTAYLKLALVKKDQGILGSHEQQNRKSFLFKIYKNLDWGGWLLFIIPIGIIFGFLECILLIMLAVNVAMFAWMCRFSYRQAQIYPSYVKDL